MDFTEINEKWDAFNFEKILEVLIIYLFTAGGKNDIKPRENE